MDPMVTCPGCGTTLKMRAAALRFIKEIQCTKCRRSVPIPPELRPSDAPAQPSTQPLHPSAPVSSAVSSPPAPAAGVTLGVGTLSFTCVGCGKKMNILKAYAGKKVKCPGCQCVNAVPELPVEKKDEPPKTAAAPVAQSTHPPSLPAAAPRQPIAQVLPPVVATISSAPQPAAADLEFLRVKREWRAYLQEELRLARQRVTDLERRMDAIG